MVEEKQGRKGRKGLGHEEREGRKEEREREGKKREGRERTDLLEVKPDEHVPRVEIERLQDWNLVEREDFGFGCKCGQKIRKQRKRERPVSLD